MEIYLQRDSDGLGFAWVTRCLRERDGIITGKARDNPILYIHMYEVEYPDGHKASLTKNDMAENMFSQDDSEGNRQILFEEIIDQRNTDQRSSSKIISSQHEMLTRSGGRKQRVGKLLHIGRTGYQPGFLLRIQRTHTLSKFTSMQYRYTFLARHNFHCGLNMC